MSSFPRLHSHCQAVFQAHVTFSGIYVIVSNLQGSTEAESKTRACVKVYLGSSSWGEGMKKLRKGKANSLLYQAGHHHTTLAQICYVKGGSVDFSVPILAV